MLAMGLMTLGLFQPQFLMREKRFELKNRPLGYLSSILVGITYAAGWTPCVGPILAAVITLGVTNPFQALPYTVVYTLGFIIPFFIMAFFIGRLKFIVKYSSIMMKIGGALTGILLYTDQMTNITVVLIRMFGGFQGF